MYLWHLQYALRIARYLFRLSTGAKFAVQGRYNENLFLGVLSRSLQGIAERPLPCNYNFHGGNTGSNPVGDAKQDKEVVEVCSGIPKRLKILAPITHQLCVL
jgi:hypothetical protein